MGANVVLKFLGELGESAYETYNIQGAAVCCCPFDNQRNINFLLRGFSKVVYNRNLLNSLKETATNQLLRFANTSDAKLVDLDKVKDCTTISEFDDAYVAPLFGYKDYLDYYNQTSCLHYLPRIRVPTLILNSRDDPFMDPYYFPWDQDCLSLAGIQNKSPIRLVRTEHGGHLGYMFHQKDNDNDSINEVEDVSFMPSEMSRFINYVQEQITSDEPQHIVDDEEDFETIDAMSSNHELQPEDKLLQRECVQVVFLLSNLVISVLHCSSRTIIYKHFLAFF